MPRRWNNKPENIKQKIKLKTRPVNMGELATITILPRYKKLAEEYVQSRNPLKAFISAGYKHKNSIINENKSKSILKRPEVLAYVKELELQIAEKLREKTNVSKEQILQELMSIGFAKIVDFGSFDENGFILKNSEDIDTDKIGAISQIESNTTTLQLDKKEDEREILKTQIKFKMHNKIEALVRMAEMLGYAVAPANTNNNVQVNINVLNRQ